MKKQINSKPEDEKTNEQSRENRLTVSLLMLSFLTGQIYSQPGGGGGLFIANLYTEKLEAINILEDSSLKIRTFILFENGIYQETFIHQTYLAESGKMRIGWNYGFGFPPTSDIDEDRYLDRESNQRMYIIYRKDTMIIDFIGIIGENGAGHSDGMDSLVIQKGYFRYYRTKKYGKSYIYEDYHKNGKLIDNGLTFHTVKHLSDSGYIEYQPVIDISFLLEDKLPASYFFKRARYYLNNNQTDAAFADISKGIKKNGGKKNCESLFLLVDAYTQAVQYDKAIGFISQAINCKRNSWEENNLNNYRKRAQLFIKAGKLDMALKDYDTIVSRAGYKIGAQNERALFMIYTQKDYESAINNLAKIIDSIPESDLIGCYSKMDQYSAIYFNLGLAEYYNGQGKKAFKHWLKAIQCGYRLGSSEEVVVHFDSIIQVNPKVPELYLTRAIAHLHRAPYLGRETRQSIIKDALNDLNKAEALGLKDFWINIYRASCFHLLKDYQRALEELNLAIEKQSNYPGAYSMRYDIREDIGLAKWGDKNDPDIVKSKILCSTWKFEK